MCAPSNMSHAARLLLSQEGKTALHWAAQFGEAGLLHDLLGPRAAGDVNSADEAGNTPLHLAALNNHLCVAPRLPPAPLPSMQPATCPACARRIRCPLLQRKGTAFGTVRICLRVVACQNNTVGPAGDKTILSTSAGTAWRSCSPVVATHWPTTATTTWPAT